MGKNAQLSNYQQTISLKQFFQNYSGRVGGFDRKHRLCKHFFDIPGSET